MKRLLFFFLMLIIGFGSLVYADADKVINMRPGQEEFYRVKNIKRISVANPYVADAKVLSGGKQIMIRAVNPGETTITIFDEQENKTVYIVKVSSLLNDKAKKIREQLEGVETVRVKIVGDKIVIDGVLLREEDKKPLAKIQELYKDVKFLVENRIGDTAKYIVSAIQSDLPEHVIVKPLGDGVMLEGTVNSEEEKKEAEKIAREYVDNVYSIIKIEEPKYKINVASVEFDAGKKALNDNLLKLLFQGLEKERGLFGMILDDTMASDNVIQALINDFNGESIFDNKEFENDGQYKISTPNGDLNVYFNVSSAKEGVYTLIVSILDSQKKVLEKKRFYLKPSETIGVAGFYKVLKKKGLLDKGDKELILFFSFED